MEKEKSATRLWQKKRKSIYIFPDTKEKLKKFSKLGDTYNDVISNLMTLFEECKEKLRQKEEEK